MGTYTQHSWTNGAGPPYLGATELNEMEAGIGEALRAENDLSDVDSAATARTNLGLGSMATETATSYLTKAGNLSGIADASAARTTLGLGTMATATATDYLSKAGNLSGLADVSAARTALGLGSMATQASTSYAALSGATFTGATMVDGTANAIQLRIQGHSTQTSQLVTFEDSAGTVVGSVSVGGEIRGTYFMSPTPGGSYLTIGSGTALWRSSNAAIVVETVRGVASQAANLQEWQNSSSTVLASVSAAGLGTFAGLSTSASVFVANTSAPSTPTGGGRIFVEGGALKFIGSSGTITTIAGA